MQPGDVVVVRDQRWTIARSETFERCRVITLEGRGPDNHGRRIQVVAPFDTVREIQAGLPRRRKRRTVLRAALTAIARERPAVGLWTAAEANLDLLPYQLEPALAVLRGATRVLLADAVGLGKTIQAGLILAELRARGLVDRALILCPAGLRASWLAELRDRFGIAAVALDHTAIATGITECPAGVNPWAMQSVVIASIDFVKRPEVLAAVEGAALDLVIADEAHHLTPGSDRGGAVERLAVRTPWLVLLSATPHSGDETAFNYLTGMGALGDSLTVFHRNRRDVGLPGSRRSHLLSIAPSDGEERLLRGVAAYARAIWHARGRSDRGVQLVAITLSRRAASSAAAVGRTLARRRALLADERLPQPVQAVFSWDEDDERDGDEPDEALACHGLIDRRAEQRQLQDLIDLAQRAESQSSKFRRLRRLLTRVREPALVFTEFRDTLNAAVEALESAFRLGSIHGGMPVGVRQRVVRQFQRGDLDVLVATDTAGEGLNLHWRCRLVINLDLPWNPLRLEQRVGRVDRLGQQRRVHAVHLLHRESVEDTVWRHLEQRRRLAEQALGELAPLADDDMARAVFEDRPLPSASERRMASSRQDESPAEAGRIARQRRLLRGPAASVERTVFASPRPRRHRDRRAVALVERTWLGPAGGMVERRVCALHVLLGSRSNPQVEATPSCGCRDTAEAWRQAAAQIGSVASSPEEPPLRPLGQALLARIEAARARLGAVPALHQASLFDRRAELMAGARREIACLADAALSRRAQSLTGPLTSHRRLVAFWPIDRDR